MQSQLAVIMFVDIVGYSAMMETDSERAVHKIRTLKTTHLEPVAKQHGGLVLKRLGDGWIIAFGSIAACVDCAMHMQDKLGGSSDLSLRIGCHFGDIVEDEDDIYGSGVNIAERIQAEAPPGGLMVSEDVFRQLSKTTSQKLNDAGVFRLKNISQPVRLYQWRPSPSPGADAADATSIAVADIDYAPQDAETAALAGDLRDQLLTRMSRRAGLVIYDSVTKTSEDATYDLRSRLRVSGGRGRLSLKLVLRSDGRPVWSENYDRSTEDIFDFCDVVLEKAEADLRLQTNAFDGDRLAHVPDDQLSVSELRARAANLYYRVTYKDWSHGLALMERAVEMKPDDGVALAMRAEAEIMLTAARYDAMSAHLLDRLAMDLDTAVEQSPGSDYVFWVRGIFRIDCLGDVEAALADAQRVRDLNPAYVETHELMGHICMMQEDYEGAAEKFGLALQRQTHDPLMPYRRFLRAAAFFCMENWEEALKEARRAADVRPNDRMLHLFCALTCDAAGLQDQAAQYRARAEKTADVASVTTRCPVLPPSQAGFRERLTAAYRGA